MCADFKIEEVFPIISEIIDSELLAKASVSRDDIARALLVHPIGKKKVEDAASRGKELDKISGNMIDWFSAKITTGSEVAAPYIEKYRRVRTKINGRKIWTYLLISEEEIFNKKVKLSLCDTEKRRERLKSSPRKPKQRNIISSDFIRNPDVVAEVLYQAKGICQHCKNNAPFQRKTDGTPYLEVHHITPLSSGGEDTVENTIALCPNCHRKMHYGNHDD